MLCTVLQNLLARLVPGLALLALFTLTASPVLTYLEPRRARRPVLGTAPLPAQPTVARHQSATYVLISTE